MSASGARSGTVGAGLGAPAPTGGELFALIAAAAARRPAAATGRWSGLLFLVGERRLLVPLAQVDLVLALPPALTPVPDSGKRMLGIANHQGTLLPIFDLGVLLGLGAAVPATAGRVLVVRRDGCPCGLGVSAVIAIRHGDASALRAAPPGGSALLGPGVQGAFDLDGERVPVLDLERAPAALLTGLA